MFALVTPVLAVPDDGNDETRRARFSWYQEPADPVVIAYHLYYFKEGADPTTAVKVVVPTPPQTGARVDTTVIEDGFEQGVRYEAFIRAASGVENDNEESEDSDHVVFLMPKFVPTPNAPSIEIQTKTAWKTIASAPLTTPSMMMARSDSMRVRVQPLDTP